LRYDDENPDSKDPMQTDKWLGKGEFKN
jgi:hypothetical protein